MMDGSGHRRGCRSRRVVAFGAVMGVTAAGFVASPARASGQLASPGAVGVGVSVEVVGRGEVAARPGVPVRKARVSRNGRRVTANVYWNQEMIKRKGHRDRFNVRLVALGLGAASPVVLKDRSRRAVPPAVEQVTIKLGEEKAKKLRAASSVALTVSQQYGLRGRHHN
ncbi:MAG: hypothetical protein U0904_10935, partial [Candidatus Nanopelagicales bacterium]|nr:hypothetical protein [Candidatus Nanopelagicales bacterium]